MLTESLMQRLRRGGGVAQFTGTNGRALWSPRRGEIPRSQLLFGPARGTYWLEGDEVHLLYEGRGKPPVHYAGPIPPKQMSPARLYLIVMWPLWVMAATVAVVLGAHLASGLSPYGLAIAVPPVLAFLLLLVGRFVRWLSRRDASPVDSGVQSVPHGRVVAPDVSLPPAVLAEISMPPRSPEVSLRLARKAARWAVLVSVVLLLVATFVLDPASEYDNDVWSWSAVIVGVAGIVLLTLSGIVLVVMAVVRALGD